MSAIPAPGNDGVPPTNHHEEKHKHIGNYEILKTVGEGSFAKVKVAVHRITKQKVALKIIDKDRLPDEYSLKNIHREAQIMRLLDHPSVIQLYEVMETKKELFLVLEFAVGGELLDYIVARGRLHEKEARKFFSQITSALAYCHTLGVVHRDLKAENLLLDENCNIKITDFGLSNLFDRSKKLITCCGSPVYSAPELIEGKRYTGPEVDCWSLGINLYAMVVGDLPFADSNLTALYNSILKGVYHVPDFVSTGTIDISKAKGFHFPTTECRDLISKLLERNPEKRWTISQAQAHPWVTHGVITYTPTTSSTVAKMRPRSEAELDPEIMEQIVAMGFDRHAAAASIVGGKFNQAAGTYYLMAVQKRTEAEKLLRAQKARAAAEAVATSAATAVVASPRDDPKSHTQNDIVVEHDRRLQDKKSVQGKPSSIIGPGLTPLPTSKPISSSALTVELSNALLHQQQAAYLVPGSPPESKSAALTAGPLTDMLQAGSHSAGSKPTDVRVSNTVVNRSSRRRAPSLTITIDPTLYLDPTHDDDASDPNFPEIRTIRFAFNCQTTTTLTPDVMIERLKNVLDKNDVTARFAYYLAECEWGDIKFEVEICKLPRLKTYGLRLKRNAGDMWDYKRLSGKICAELEL
ncbi:Map microtubule affinity-regulating kinase [Entophlyctis luteolus]|nr:Map microtubule affinity-regulating kinase [Entophlyctis luteolus]